MPSPADVAIVLQAGLWVAAWLVPTVAAGVLVGSLLVRRWGL